MNEEDILPGNHYYEKGTVYVLELDYGKYYVGWTQKLDERLKNHFGGRGCQWTKKYKPLRIIEKFENCNKLFENQKTLEYMAKHLYHNVRGGQFCAVNMTPKQRAIVNNSIKKWNREKSEI